MGSVQVTMWSYVHLLLGWWILGLVAMLGAEEQDPIKVLQQITNRHRIKNGKHENHQHPIIVNDDPINPFLLKVKKLKKSRIVENKETKNTNIHTTRTDRFMRKMGKVQSDNVIRIKWRKLSKDEVTRK